MKPQKTTRADGSVITEWVDDENDTQPKKVGSSVVKQLEVCNAPIIEYMTIQNNQASTNWLICLCAYLLFLILINQ